MTCILISYGSCIFRSDIHGMYPNKFVQMDEKRFRIFNTLYELPGEIPQTYLHRPFHEILVLITSALSHPLTGAQWLSGRVLDSKTEGLSVRASRASLHCVLEQDTFILA